MPFDIYTQVGNGLNRVAVPAGSPLPASAKPEQWVNRSTHKTLPPEHLDDIKDNGFVQWEGGVEVTGPEEPKPS